MNRTAAVVVTVLVLVSSVVPVSAVSGTAEPSVDADVGPLGDLDSRADLDRGTPSGTSGIGAAPASTSLSNATGNSSSTRLGNTGFEPYYYYVEGLVNVANGNLHVSATDAAVGALGPDLELERSYNSLRSGEHGPFGFGWTHSYDVHLVERDDGTVVLSDADGSTHTFTPENGGYAAPAGVHARLRETGSGFALDYLSGKTYRFDAGGTLLSIADRNGNRLDLSYTGDRLTTVSDGSGQRLELTYTPEGRIETVTDPLGRTVEYRYETGDLVAVVDPAGRTTHYAYYANHKLERIVRPSGLTRLFSYDAADRVDCLELGFEGVSSDNSPDCNGFSLGYDVGNGSATVTSVPTGETTTLALDDTGSPVRVTTARGEVTFDWDADRNLAGMTNSSGTTTFTYDAYGNLLSRTDALGNDVHQGWQIVETSDRYLALRTSRTDERGATTSYGYDDSGNLVSVTNPLGDTRTLGYDPVGNRVNETDFGGHETTYTFDSHGFLASITDPEGNTETIGMDRAGRIVNVTDPRGNSQRYTYDVFDRVVRITDPLGNETRIEYDDGGRVVNVTTAAGRVISPEFRLRDDGGQVSTDSRGNIDGIATGEHAIDRQFDTLNRLTAETIDLGPTSVDVEYGYDAAGNLVSRTVAGETTTYEYDALGRVTNVTGPAGGWVSYTYDAAGRRTWATYSNGVTTHYEYDAAGNLLHLHGVRENRTTVTTASASTMATTNGTATPSTTPAATGTATSSTTATTTSPSPTATPTATTTTTTTATPEPTTTSSDTATPEPSPSPTSTSSSTDASTSESLPGTTAASTATNETLFEYTYTYDASGNRLTETDGSGRVTRYEYDALDRLVGVEFPNGETISYTYDAVGNRLTRRVNGTGVTGYAYSASDELRNAGSTTYTHDSAGNRRSKQDGTNTTIYAYGSDGRLANVTLPDGRNVSYTYLPTGERLSRTTENGTTYYLYSDFDPVGTVAENGTVDRRYVKAPRVDEMLSLSEGDERYFYHYDPSGNVRFVTDENGSVANAYDYGAFGTLRRSAETVENPYRFAGRPQDTETGLYYNRLRYYDPETGRFTREDPARLAAGVNFYTYAENNPVRYRDPTGLAATSVWTGACSGGGGMAVVVGADISSCVLTNLKTGQTCSVSVFAFKFGGGLGIGGGAQVNLQTGAECGGGLQGGSFSAFGEWNAGCLGGSVDVNTDSPGVGTSQGPGTDCGAGLAGGGKYTHMEVNSCSCECSCGQFCEEGECDEDDDRPPGGDHPDDNHDLSVLGYDSVYPDFEYDRGSSMAVLDRGFVTEIEDFLAAKNLTAGSVDVRTSQSDLDRYDVLVVPTGGLLGLSSLPSFEGKLETFVRNGGTLVVLPQQRGYEFEPVPGELKGYGWLEDQSCQYNSIGLTNACAVVSSLDSETASVNVDGYFTDWPANATILLSRTVNGQPAMLTYDRGEGRVLATTVYTDWAFGHHAASDEGELLLRNVLAWATSPPDVPVYRAGETVTHDLNATNYVEVTADELRVDLRRPDGTVHSMPPVRTSVEGFSNRTVNVTYDLPATTDYGIWRVGYTLLNDSYGEIQRVEDAGSISVSRFSEGDSLYRSENVTFAVSSDAERYADGANATFRITIRNSGTVNETVTAWWAFPHNYGRVENSSRLYGARTTRPGEDNSSLNRTVVVPAGGETTIVHEVPVYSYDRLWAQFYRGDRNSTDYLGRTSRAFYSFSPTVDVSVDTARAEYRLGERVNVSLGLDGPASSATTDLRAVGPESTLVHEEEVHTVLDGNGSHNVSTTFDLPTDAPPGFYTVVADTEVGGEKAGFDSAQFFVPDARIRAVPEVPATVENGSQVGFTLVNVGREDSTTGLDVSLVAPDNSTVWNDSTTVDVPAEDRVTTTFGLETGPRQFGTYRLVYTVSPEREDPFTREYALSSSWLATLALDQPSYVVRETVRANLTVTNDGQFGGPLPVTLSVPDVNYTRTDRLTVAPGENTTVEHAVALPTGLAPGEHRAVVTLGGADPSERVFSFVVPPSSLETALASDGPFAPGENVSLELTNTGGVDTNASCALALIGPRGVRVDERDVDVTVRTGETVTVNGSLPRQVISGTYFLDATCEDLESGETTSRTETFAVDGLDADLSMSTDKEVYATGENVTVTVDIDNRGDAIRNGTLTVEVADPSSDATANGSATGTTTSTTADRATVELPIASAPLEGSTTTVFDGSQSTKLRRDGRFTAASLAGGATRTRLAATAAAIPASTTNVTGNLSISNATTWQDRAIVLDGNLSVEPGGSLTLRNTSLYFEVDRDFDAGIEVRDGGTLRVLEGSNVSTADRYDDAYFRSLAGSTLELRDSAVGDMGGYGASFLTEGGVVVRTDDAVVENTTLFQNYYGLIVYNATGVVVRNSTFRQSQDLRLRDTTGVRIEGNTFESSAGTQIETSENVTFRANDGTEAEVSVVRSSNVTVGENTYTGRGSDRFYLDGSSGNRVEANVLDGVTIDLYQSDGNVVANNTVTQENDPGLDVDVSNNNTLRGNDVVGGSVGIVLSRLQNVSLVGNTVNGSTTAGISLREALDVTMRDNALVDTNLTVDRGYFAAPPRPIAYYYHDVDTSNTLDGAPIHYLLNETDAAAPTDGGVLYLVNASNVTVGGPNGGSVNVVGSRNVTVRDGVVGDDTYGLFVYNSTGTTVTNLTARDATEGIHVRLANRTSLSGNVVENNTDYGIRVIGDYDRLVTGIDIRGNRAYEPSGIEANVFVQRAEGAIVTGNDVASARDGGIFLSSAPNSTLEDNVVTGSNYDGINVASSDGATVSNNTVSGMTFGIELSRSADARVVDNDVTATSGDGLGVSDVTNVTVRDNRVRDVTDVGISVNGAENGTVARNDVWNVTQEGIQVRDAIGLTVRDNDLTDVGEGSYRGLLPAIAVSGQRSYYSRTERVTVSNNSVVTNGTGISVTKVDVALLDGNDVRNSSVGIDLEESYGVTVRNHTLGGGGFNVTGSALRYYRHDIDGSNTVGGAPVRYLLNETGTTVDGSGFGQVWLVNASDVTLGDGGSAAVVRSRNVTVEDVVASGLRRGVYVYDAANVTVESATLRNGTIGVSVASSSRVTVRNASSTGVRYGVYAEANYQRAVNNTTVENSDFSDGTYGIHLVETTNDTIVGGRLTGYQYGIDLEDTEGVEVNGTNVSDSQYGIHIRTAVGTLVRHSTVTNSDYGIYLYSSQGSLIYDNYFENPNGTNAWEAYTSYSGEPNRWNVSKTPGENIVGGPFLGGNYYHDYTGEDTDGDGLGDTDLGSYGFAEGDYHPLVLPTDRGSVLWSRNVTVDVADSTNETVTVVVPAAVLSGSSGKLKVSAWLTSTSNQTVATEDPPFYVFDGDTVLTLEPDARRYRPGETVELTGRLENRGNVSRTYDLSVEANGTERLAETATLAAGENHSYATNVTVTKAGSLDLQASAGEVVVEDRVEVIEPQVAATIVAPTTVGRAPFDAALELENTGRIEATVDASFLGTNRSVTLAPNETVMLETTTSVEGDTVLEATLTGDVSRTVRRAVDFGEAATVTVSPESVSPEGTVGVPYTVENTGTLDVEFDVTFTLDNRTRTRTVYLPAGGRTNGTLVYDLTPGTYTLAYETPFGNGSSTVRVAARNQVALTADAADHVENGTLVVNVSLANTGPNDVDGRLRVNSSVFDTSREFTVLAGQTLNRTVNVSVPEGTDPGTRNVTVEAFTEGERLGRVTDRFDLLGAQIGLVSGPGVQTYGLGERARLNVTLENTGDYEGTARLNVSVPGIHQSDRRVFLAPGERRVVPVSFLVPDDLAAGRYPVEYRLDDGPVQETELVVEGMNVSVTAALNDTLYENGDTARLTLDVQNERSFPVSLFSRVQYNGYDEVRSFDLAADGSTSVDFDVPVREGTDRKAFYSVYAGSGRSLHIDGAYIHRRDPNVTLYTDQQVYDIGDTVTVTVDPSQTGRLDLYAPGFTWSGEVSGRRNLTFTVPELRSGSYNVVYTFANTTRSYPFDVDGYTARVVEAELDSANYTGGDDVGLALTVEADRTVPVTVTARVYGEGSTALDESNTSTTLSPGRNQVALLGTLPENVSGIHSVVYTIDADRSVPITLATGSEYFDVAGSSTATNAPPVARFDHSPTVPVSGESVRFDASRSSDSDGSITAFAWDFDGDLAFDATGEQVTHTFATAGDYTVTLRVTDDDGQTSVTTRTITVDVAPATPTPTPTPSPGTPTPTPAPPAGGGGGGGGLPTTPVSGIVEVVGGTLVDGTVTTGSTVDVRVDLTNPDARHGRITLTLAADGTVVTERTVSVAPSTDRSVLLSHRFTEAGTYTLSVDGVEVGTVTVTEAQSGSATATATPDATRTPTPTTGTATAAPDAGSPTPTGTVTATPATGPSTPTAGDGPGFSVLVALLAMGLFALLARRRRPPE